MSTDINSPEKCELGVEVSIWRLGQHTRVGFYDNLWYERSDLCGLSKVLIKLVFLFSVI